jgi:hypothetical protein
MVSRQISSSLQTTNEYYCEEHEIYISPSTFEYKKEQNNLLWSSKEDLRYFHAVKECKRESRMARERSEDALTWNVFRYLQAHRHICSFLETFTGHKITDPELIFWSYSSLHAGTWFPLADARDAFAEPTGRGSEPDLIIDTTDHLFIIEVKFTSNNQTKPSDYKKLYKYETAELTWYEQAFQEEIYRISVEKQKYELMRFWLMGTWLAHERNKAFTLISLTPEGMDPGLKEEFGSSIRLNPNRSYIHLHWEGVIRFIREKLPNSMERDMVLHYMENKTAGYSSGKLQRAFR